MKAKGQDSMSAEDKALTLFSEMMISKIESIKSDWKKPWFTEGAMQWPKNLSGRDYNGMNSLMLLMLCEKKGYTIPRFCTFAAIQRLNRGSEEGEQADKGQPFVHVNRGEKSFPVFLYKVSCVNKETKERIPFEDYKLLSDEERSKYSVHPHLQVFNVFNVAQTNLQEARPELWAKLEKENSAPLRAVGEDFAFEPMDKTIAEDLWICPIKPQHQDRSFYSISKKEIVVPEKAQFKDDESFYGTIFHEMTHSTGAADVLGRIKSTSFGSADYAREELVAELGAALVAQRYGMARNIKEDSAAYLKSWLDALRESPSYIKTVLMDVKKASGMITQHIDKVALEIEQAKDVREDVGRGVSLGEPKETLAFAGELVEAGEDMEVSGGMRGWRR